MRRPISQTEARRLRKRVQELENIIDRQGQRWASNWPGGVNFWTLTAGAETKAAMGTARALGHAIVVVPDGDKLKFFALPVAKP